MTYSNKTSFKVCAKSLKYHLSDLFYLKAIDPDPGFSQYLCNNPSM